MKPRSFFHIGDMIQIVSGSKYAVLDPDNKISTGREQLDFVDDTFGENDSSFADTFPDECAPCIGVFGCDMRAPLQGKIIRIRLCKRNSYDVDPSVDLSESHPHWDCNYILCPVFRGDRETPAMIANVSARSLDLIARRMTCCTRLWFHLRPRKASE